MSSSGADAFMPALRFTRDILRRLRRHDAKRCCAATRHAVMMLTLRRAADALMLYAMLPRYFFRCFAALRHAAADDMLPLFVHSVRFHRSDYRSFVWPAFILPAHRRFRTEPAFSSQALQAVR